jgi:hypothetical protein
MAEKIDLNNYQPIVGILGDCYRPIPKDGASTTPKTVIPPKGGTGARTIQLRPINVNADKK